MLLLDLQMDEWAGDQIESLARLTSVLVLTASERIEEAMAALRTGRARDRAETFRLRNLD